MGRSYEGIYFFGVVTREYESETHIFGEHAEFSDWAEEKLGIHRKDYLDYPAFKKASREAQIARWGCVFDSTWMGVLDYHSDILFPKGAKESAYYGGAPVPQWDDEQIAFWRECFAKLRQDLPALEEPALFYGCQVG